MFALLLIPASPILTLPNVAEAAPHTEIDLHTLASTTAEAYGINPVTFAKVVSCESNWDPDAVGDQGTSFGLVQIHLPAHPDISESEADDPDFALSFMAREWLAGDQDAWSCYREIAPR